MCSGATLIRMTRWHAVLAGLVLAFVVEMAVWGTFGGLTLFGGLLGSLTAGFLAGDDVTDGAWHGLLSALAWGIVLMPAGVLLTLVRGHAVLFPFELVVPLLSSPGEMTTALIMAVTLPNVGAGGVGSLLRRRTEWEPPRLRRFDWAKPGEESAATGDRESSRGGDS